MLHKNRLFLLPLAVIAFAHAAAAQTTAPFNIRVLPQGQSGYTISEGGTVALAAEAPRTPLNATIVITYRGTTAATITRAVFTGSLDFEFTSILDETPITLTPNQSLTLPVRYNPRSGTRITGQLVLTYTETGRPAATLTLNLVGTAPEYAFSFIPRDGNATPLTPGGIIAFPVTPIDSTSPAVVVINNRGTAPGTFTAATVSGAAFQLAGVPLPATPIEAGRELRFTVNFTPRQLDLSTGSLAIDIPGAQTSFNLAGAGSGPSFAYEIVQPIAGPLAPEGLIVAPETPVGEKSTVTIRVRNTGNADARIATIAVQGAAFQLTDAPFLPVALAPGAAAALTVTFSPTEPGRASGRLRIGDASFDLAGNALGAVLSYAYATGDTSTNVPPGGNIVFTPAPLGGSSAVQLRIVNTGTLPGAINSIAISGSNVFTLGELPPFPAQIAPGATIAVPVTFTPTALGPAAATLRVNAQAFNLSGTGSNPSPLPEYRIEGPSGSVEARQQPAVRLVLSRSYPLQVNGTLALAFSSAVFSDDPAVQFATGGRSVTFTIPANSTQAVFPDGSSQMRLQTGTVSGTITLTPSFSTENGVSLTPSNPPALRLTVPQEAPRILNALITNRSNNGFTLQITGYSTSRSVTRVNLTFTPRSGENLETTSLALNVESTFLAWYQSAQSQPFGSLFSVSIPLTLTGDVRGTNLALIDTIQSVAVTLSNAQGTSNSISIDNR